MVRLFVSSLTQLADFREAGCKITGKFRWTVRTSGRICIRRTSSALCGLANVREGGEGGGTVQGRTIRKVVLLEFLCRMRLCR